MTDSHTKSAASKKFGEALSKDLKNIKTLKETKEQQRSSKESFMTTKGEAHDSREIKVKEYLQQHWPLDNTSMTINRTADDSIAKEPLESSFSASQLSTKQKLISLLLDRSKMSPSREEESVMRLISGEEAPGSEDLSRRSNVRSTQRNLSQRSPTKEIPASGRNQPTKKLNQPQQPNNPKSTIVNEKNPTRNLPSIERDSGKEEKSVKQSFIAQNIASNKQNQPASTFVKQVSPSEVKNINKWEVETKVIHSTQLKVEESEDSPEKIVETGIRQSVIKIQKLENSPEDPKSLIGEESDEQSSVSFSVRKGPERTSEPRVESENTKLSEKRSSKEEYNLPLVTSGIKSNDTSMVTENDSELQAAVKALNIKIFLTIRSILKPHPYIQRATQAVLCLLSGLSPLIPKEVVLRGRMEWSEIKSFLQSPIFLVNQVNSFKEYCDSNQIDITSIAKANKLITPTQTEESYSSEAYNALRDFVRSAINYFLATHKEYNEENLRQFDSNPTHESADTTEPRPVQKSQPAKNQQPTNQWSKRSQSPLNANDPPLLNVNNRPQTNARPQATQMKSPTSLSPPRNGLNVTPAKYETPRHQESQKETPNHSAEQTFKYAQHSRVSPPQFYNHMEPRQVIETQVPVYLQQRQPPIAIRKYAPVQSRVGIAPRLTTPENKAQHKAALNKSYDDIRTRSGERSSATNAYFELQRKINKAIDEKSHRSATQTPKRTFSRSIVHPEDKDFLEELSLRLALEEESQAHKKAARDYKQKIARLLIDQERKRKLEAKMDEAAREDLDREIEKVGRKNLDEFLSVKEKEERIHDLDIYREKQLSRIVEKELKKDREEDELFHELTRNYEEHNFKLQLDIQQKIRRQEVLKDRLLKICKDRQFKRLKAQQEREEEARELRENRQNRAIWKKTDALHDRIQAEQEYLLLERLINGK